MEGLRTTRNTISVANTVHTTQRIHTRTPVHYLTHWVTQIHRCELMPDVWNEHCFWHTNSFGVSEDIFHQIRWPRYHIHMVTWLLHTFETVDVTSSRALRESNSFIQLLIVCKALLYYILLFLFLFIIDDTLMMLTRSAHIDLVGCPSVEDVMWYAIMWQLLFQGILSKII